MFDDLRSFIDALDNAGQLQRVEGASWDLEIGAITAIMAERQGSALLFDKIDGYPEGYRVATAIMWTSARHKLAFGIPETLSDLEAVEYWKDRIGNYKPIPPVEVESAPIMENVLIGDKADILRFPTPKWHEKDGGRYIGTFDNVITKCPDEEWVNVGTYRVQIHDKDTLGFYVSPGQHAHIMRERYWSKGKDCPVVMCFGQEPLLLVSSMRLPWGMPEYDFAGYIKGRPIEVIRGEFTGLPIPATAEIAIEGFSPPPSADSKEEGPFGEWTGYYASGSRIEPVVKIKAIYHRNNPIILGQPPMKPPLNPFPIPLDTVSSVWEALERAGAQGLKGVWLHVGSRIILVISIEQMYLGHAKQVATLGAALLCGNACEARYVVVVDEDIDPSNMDNVIWAISTRCNPGKSIDIVRGFTDTPLDPMFSPEERQIGDITTSKVIVNACRPYHWKENFPDVCELSERLRKKVIDKWGYLFP
jgi:UbiD family decarboxylase